MKRLQPYIITVIIFCGLFVLTQVIETRVWYLGFNADSGAVVNDHKTTVQLMIFVLGLSIWLAVLSLSVAVKHKFYSTWSILLMNVLTIIIIYWIDYYLSKIIDSGGFNIYYDWRKNMGIPLTIITIVSSTLLTLIIRIMKSALS